MMKPLTLLAAALLAVLVQFPAAPAEARGGRGLGIGLGVAAGVAGLLIISEAARAEGYRRGPRCRRLINMCDDGEGWACRRFHRECE